MNLDVWGNFPLKLANDLGQGLKEMKMRIGRRLNGFLGLALDDGTIIFLVILLDETVSVW